MNLQQVVDQMRSSPDMMERVTAWRVIPARPPAFADFPPHLDAGLIGALQKKGISRLYTHQAAAIGAVGRGDNIAVVTDTASGKTLCYMVPVLNALLGDPESRAIFLFPTKALSQDQLTNLYEMIRILNVDIKTYTYDGDTPANARRAVRAAGHIVITNPDMLHTGILPHHTKWVRLFENLKFVVIDEVHQYRGVFGSHVANVIRRLKRICAFYGSKPQFILSSATIANPVELATKLVEEAVTLIDNDGSPRGQKHFIFYNPPVVNRELGIRASSLLEARSLARNFLLNGIQTIVFGRTRRTVELLLTYLQEDLPTPIGRDGAVRGYRGGYLPDERREIERGLREGQVRAVAATNALELGIDIGQLDACVMTGYPGTITSTWQQAGRAGRRNDVSCAMLVASSNPLDQFIITHPDYFFGQSPEQALINPDNLLILMSHLRCAAFELPFRKGEKFGVETTEEILGFLEEEGILHSDEEAWHWMAESYPADEISLRMASSDNVVIIDTTEGADVVGEVDTFSAPLLVHEGAIYMHQGQQYHVDKLDWDERKAYVHRVDVDHYTDANLAVEVRVLDRHESSEQPNSTRSWGEVLVSATPTIYKKIKLFSHENVGWGDIRLPSQELQTTAYWLHLPKGVRSKLGRDVIKGGLLGVSHVLANVAPLYLMCDPRDLGVVAQLRSPFTEAPTIFIYDRVPAGIGFSERLYSLHEELLRRAAELIESCECDTGCPSCVGPVNLVGQSGKHSALLILREIL